ncbi:ArsR/SmtB family transcription factor [Nocardioides campestrisoli]|uniref:ArsR/SmtB family transcription factor n=1 Tax=Nocardioides campestrisoli TaxID=2736757 RepID=UPI00163D43CA|nr:helix-turn-helix domain-containing protein [Nocardioides campestrisoli]
MSLDDRVTDLERRIAALEATQITQTSQTSQSPAAAADPVFWALEGLRARVPGPGAVMLVGHVELPDGRTAQWQEGAVTQDLLELDWATTSDAFAALGHPVRLRLLQQVLAGVATVPELTATEGVGTSGQVYHHLRQLVAAGWLSALGGGRYEVPVARVVPALVMVQAARR